MRQCLNKKLSFLNEHKSITSDEKKSEVNAINETTYSLPAFKRISQEPEQNHSDEIKVLRNRFMKAGKLRNDILKTFSDIEDGTLDISSITAYNNLNKKIEEFISLFNMIADDIEAYKDIPFKHYNKATKQIINSPFTENELEDLIELWTEDADTFETRVELLSYEKAMRYKYASIARAYNLKSLSSNMTAEDIEHLFENIIFADYEMFRLHKNFIKRLVSSTVPAITIKRTLDAIITDYRPTSPSKLRTKKELLDKMPINESSLIEGFYNPFDDEDDYLDTDKEAEIKKYHVMKKDPDMIEISKVKMWNTNVPNKVICKTNGCFAGKNFNTGDIIEDSPVKVIPSDAMYSKSIRDAAFQFELDDGSSIYGIPLGYISCYRTRHSSGIPGNVDYELDPESLRVQIIATKNIRRGQELILNTNDTDFANELNPDKFNYKPGVEPIYSTEFQLV